MSNWCSNRLVITGQSVFVDELQQIALAMLFLTTVMLFNKAAGCSWPGVPAY
ncbi:hypothetical protein SME10J_47300 [Serratia marcescens]|nr:hypothetical protein SME10J_47300 [Serratia marcescens]